MGRIGIPLTVLLLSSLSTAFAAAMAAKSLSTGSIDRFSRLPARVTFLNGNETCVASPAATGFPTVSERLRLALYNQSEGKSQPLVQPFFAQTSLGFLGAKISSRGRRTFLMVPSA